MAEQEEMERDVVLSTQRVNGEPDKALAHSHTVVKTMARGGPGASRKAEG